MNSHARRARSSGRSRFLLGGIGGTAPVLLNLLIVDLQTLMLDLKPLAVASYLIRVCALFAIGGLVGWMHRTEAEPFKLFLLGIGAPALITGAINGRNITLPSPPEHASVSSLFIGEAHAQDTPGAKTFALPEETSAQQIARGLLGTKPSNVFYVIVDSKPTLAEAQARAEQVRQQGYPADVYNPFASNPNYAVVIGANLELPDAQALRVRAIESGLSDAYIWTFPPK